jgi:hypothetical protein
MLMLLNYINDVQLKEKTWYLPVRSGVDSPDKVAEIQVSKYKYTHNTPYYLYQPQ